MRKVKTHIKNIKLEDKKSLLKNSSFDYKIYKNSDGIMKVSFFDTRLNRERDLMDIDTMLGFSNSYHGKIALFFDEDSMYRELCFFAYTTKNLELDIPEITKPKLKDDWEIISDDN